MVYAHPDPSFDLRGLMQCTPEQANPSVAGFMSYPGMEACAPGELELHDETPATNFSEYCWDLIEDPSMLAWAEPPQGFERCLFSAKNYELASPLDKLMIMVAFSLVGSSIGSDRQQQLFNRSVRQLWFGSGQGGSAFGWRGLFLIWQEIVLNWCLVPIMIACMIALLITNKLDSINILLNGVAVRVSQDTSFLFTPPCFLRRFPPLGGQNPGRRKKNHPWCTSGKLRASC